MKVAFLILIVSAFAFPALATPPSQVGGASVLVDPWDIYVDEEDEPRPCVVIRIYNRETYRAEERGRICDLDLRKFVASKNSLNFAYSQYLTQFAVDANKAKRMIRLDLDALKAGVAKLPPGKRFREAPMELFVLTKEPAPEHGKGIDQRAKHTGRDVKGELRVIPLADEPAEPATVPLPASNPR